MVRNKCSTIESNCTEDTLSYIYIELTTVPHCLAYAATKVSCKQITDPSQKGHFVGQGKS